LEQNAANLERARRHVANLAHGLKTPLATLALALEEPGHDSERRLLPLVALMDRRIRHHLTRARTAVQGGPERARSMLAPRIADHVAAFTKLYADKHLEFMIVVPEDAVVACETQDLDEMLGNLLDNACKWSHGHVRVTAENAAANVCLYVEDDGPGLTPHERGQVGERGERLDESVPGSGLGLAIVRDIAKLYAGSLNLDSSPLGGLRARLTLPAVVETGH
ncbi:MAG TPA: ATP-binding protein, partial [Rhizomicrobium sp.]|nr:ATP-binding protein [Rhizomicrobium sp.]